MRLATGCWSGRVVSNWFAVLRQTHCGEMDLEAFIAQYITFKYTYYNEKYLL